MKQFSDIEEKILNRIQKDFKITEFPFKELSKELEIDEIQLLDTVKNLKNQGIIRDISAIFNADRLGYDSSLITFEVHENDIEIAKDVINEHPGVSHNYLRDHKFNVWFTLSIDDSTSSIEETVLAMAEKSRARDYLILRNERLFKIGLMLNVGTENKTNEHKHTDMPFQEIKNREQLSITDIEKKAIYLLQCDLPLVKRPFQYLINENNVDMDEKRLVSIGEKLKEKGVMRRYSAVLKHQKAGYSANAMTAWKLDKSDGKNDIITEFSMVPNISHLYLRTVYPGRWEHPLFAMIHAKTENELNAIIKNLEEKSGITDYLVLRSLREFKKSRVKYFSEDYKRGQL